MSKKKTKTTAPKKSSTQIAVKGYTRKFSAAKLPPRTQRGRFTRRRQGDLFR